MINRTVTTVIDPEKCTGCGLCVKVCPSETLSMSGEKAVVSGDRSLGCGHCVAVCPVQAVQVKALDPGSLVFQTFDLKPAWLAPGDFDTAELVRLMASRRSCRNFKEKPVPRALLQDLVKTGTMAPSGTNSQRWTFTVLPEREDVLSLGRRIGDFFRRINRMAENKPLRLALKLLGKPSLDNYYRDYYQSVKKGLDEWEQQGRDRLFHGAAAAIIVGARPGASCPQEDALLASANILLAAHSMGLGTCMIGFAVEAMQNDAGIKDFLGIPAEEAVYAVIALGWPDEKYRGLTGRKKLEPRFVELKA